MFRRALGAALCLMSLYACGPATDSKLSSNPFPRSFDKSELAARFAPILHLHPQELYVPMDPEAFLSRDENERDEDFFLSARRDYLNGYQGRTITNVSDDGRSIQYWVFSPKNGCQGGKIRYRIQGAIKIGNLGETLRTLELCNIAIHEGDWENITLRLSSDLSRVESAYLSAHGRGNWLPASALEFRDRRPYVYSALNSHAFYAKDIGFYADTTITHAALDAILGINWFQVGDIVSGQAYVQRNPEDGPRSIDFDTQKALWNYAEIQNEILRDFKGLWGKTVNAKEVLNIPELSFGPIEAVLKIALNAALLLAPELKNQSTGTPPPSPWARDEWQNFNDQTTIANGLAFDTQHGGEGGQAFVDYERLKSQNRFKVREIWLRSGDRVDQVCIKLDELGDLCHGGKGGSEHRLVLEDGEYIQNQGMCFGEKDGDRRVFAIKFTTNTGRSVEGGSWTEDCVWQYAPEQMQLVGWYGASGSEVDNLGPIYGTLSP